MILGSDYEVGHFNEDRQQDLCAHARVGGTDVRRKMSEQIVRFFDIQEACAKLDMLSGVELRLAEFGPTRRAQAAR